MLKEIINYFLGSDNSIEKNLPEEYIDSMNERIGQTPLEEYKSNAKHTRYMGINDEIIIADPSGTTMTHQKPFSKKETKNAEDITKLFEEDTFYKN